MDVRFRELDEPRTDAMGVDIVLKNTGKTVILLRHSRRSPEGNLVLFEHLKVERIDHGSSTSVKANEWDEVFWPAERGPFRNILEFEAVMPRSELALAYVLSFEPAVPDNATLRFDFWAPSYDTMGSAENLEIFRRPGRDEVKAKAYRHTPYESIELVVERTTDGIRAGEHEDDP